MPRALPQIILTVLASSPSVPQSPPQAPLYPDHTRLLVIRDHAGHETPVRSPSDWNVRKAHILAHLQDVMGPLPGGERRVPLDLQVLAEFDEPHYTRRKIQYAAEPGDRVPAWLLIPKKPTPRPALICLHQTTPIGKDEPAGLGGLPNLHYAAELAKRGYVTLAPDYPRFGEYQVDPYKLGYQSASMKAIWNHMRGIDLLQSLPEVDPDRIGAIGHSLGGHNALFLGAFDERVKLVASSCGFNAFPSYYGGNIAGWSHEGYMPRLRTAYALNLKQVPFDFPELLATLAPRPVFINAPLRDGNFEVSGVRACVDAASPIYKLLQAQNALHPVYPDAEHDFPPETREQAYQFIDQHLALDNP